MQWAPKKSPTPSYILDEWSTGFGSARYAFDSEAAHSLIKEFCVLVAAGATANATLADQKLGDWEQTLLEERLDRASRTFNFDDQVWMSKFAEEKIAPTTSFLSKYKSRITSGPDGSLGSLFREIDDLLRGQKTDELEAAFAEETFADYSNDIIVGVLSLTAVVKTRLPSWQAALARAREVLTERQADVERELVGL